MRNSYSALGTGMKTAPTPAMIWTPAQLGSSVVKAQYDASNVNSVTVATGVSQWNDISGNNNHLTQGTGANQPAYTSGVKVTFDGTDDALGSSNTIKNSSVNFLAVRSSSDFLNIIYYPNSTSAYAGCCVVADTTNPTGENSGTPSYYGDGAILSSPNRDDLNTAYNTGSKKIVGIIGMDTNNVNWDSGIGIGYYNSTFADACDYHEIVITTGTLSTSDRQKIEGYLAWKWGLEGSLDAGHPYKNFAPTIGM